MTKADIINEIAEKTGVDKADVTASVEAFFSVVKNSMSNGNNIYIRGFGSFTVRKYKAYEGRNPRTGETVHVAEKRLPFFKVGKDLRERVNAGLGTPLPADKPDEPDDTDPNDPEYDDDDED